MEEKTTDSQFSTRELQEILRWYIELPFSVDIDMDVVLHLLDELCRIEQLENSEYHVDVEAAWERFKKRLAEDVS